MDEQLIAVEVCPGNSNSTYSLQCDGGDEMEPICSRNGPLINRSTTPPAPVREQKDASMIILEKFAKHYKRENRKLDQEIEALTLANQAARLQIMKREAEDSKLQHLENRLDVIEKQLRNFQNAAPRKLTVRQQRESIRKMRRTGGQRHISWQI